MRYICRPMSCHCWNYRSRDKPMPLQMTTMTMLECLLVWLLNNMSLFLLFSMNSVGTQFPLKILRM